MTIEAVRRDSLVQYQLGRFGLRTISASSVRMAAPTSGRCSSAFHKNHHLQTTNGLQHYISIRRLASVEIRYPNSAETVAGWPPRSTP